MPINATKYQTVLVSKERLSEVRSKVQKRTRIPIVKIVDFAIHQLMNNPNAETEIMDWLEGEGE